MSWSLDIKEMPWVEHTREEVDFVIEALGLRGPERILDLACGFGRHALDLSRRGFQVVGVDSAEDLVLDARAYLDALLVVLRALLLNLLFQGLKSALLPLLFFDQRQEPAD